MRKTAGVTHITIFTQPQECGGKCLYCPQVPGMPKSYLPHADITKFGLSYSAKSQIQYWLKKTIEDGMPGTKLEIIILGGSFLAHSWKYQEEFIKEIYEAVEDSNFKSIEEAVELHSHSSGNRIIGITIEARPDQITEMEILRLFKIGVTKIEIGAQSLDNKVLEANRRGHTSHETENAIRIIRKCGLKVGVHLLFGMPYSNIEKDVLSAKEILTAAQYRPDHIKFYFCEMFRKEFMDHHLVSLFENKIWQPYTIEERNEVLKKVIPMVAPSTRISRISRKCSDNEVEDKRVWIDRGIVEQKFNCRCIRCREPLPDLEAGPVEIKIDEWKDDEVYFELGADGRCIGVLRLHIEKEKAIVRELHVYGIETKCGRVGIHQHRGIGKTLLKTAEEFAIEKGCIIIDVASGTGVREYYIKRGYKLDKETGFMRKTYE